MRAGEVNQIWVWGDPLSNYLVAVVVPEFDVFAPLLQERLGPSAPKTHEEMCHDQRAINVMMERLNAQATEAKLLGFQKVKAVILEPCAWTVESGLITPTMKNRRAALLTKYKNALQKLYSE